MKKKIRIIILIIFILLSSGCTKYISDSSNKRVIYDKTGQNLTQNILCKPEETELYNLYKKYDKKLSVNLKLLPTCESFKPNDIKYVSIWESIFVKPLAFVILKLGNLIKNYGVSVMLIGLLIRLIMFPLSKSMIKQSENMKKAQPEISKIEKKYKDKTDSESMMAKSQETMMVYKKYNINPVSGCLTSFIQLPLFFAFLEAINRVPAIFEENLLGLQLGTTPLKGITSGNYLYIILIILIVGTTYLSMKNSMAQTGSSTEQAGMQMQFMTKFMIIMISIASLSLPAAIGLYWITTNGFAVIQNLLLKEKKVNRKK